VLVGAYLLNPLLRAQSLTDLAESDLGYDGAPFEDLPTEDFIERGAEFVAITRQLYENQMRDLSEMPKLTKVS